MAYLARRSANFAPLTPLTFLARASQVFPTYPAIVYDDWKSRLGDTETPAAVTQSYSETATRVTQLASALAGAGIQRGDTVAVLSPNTPAFIEAHHAVNAAGAALNPLNVRVDKSTLAYVLEHCEAKVVLSDTAYAGVMRGALDELSASRTRSTPLPIVIDIVDPIEVHAAGGEQIGDTTYEALLASGSSSFEWRLPEDEWETQAINYTSGTTGRPKGVLYHHRGVRASTLLDGRRRLLLPSALPALGGDAALCTSLSITRLAHSVHFDAGRFTCSVSSHVPAGRVECDE